MRIKKATIATTLTSNAPSGCLGVERPPRWIMGRSRGDSSGIGFKKPPLDARGIYLVNTWNAVHFSSIMLLVLTTRTNLCLRRKCSRAIQRKSVSDYEELF